MPSKLRLRYIFKSLIKLIAKAFIRIGIKNPNVITIMMLSAAILSMLLLVFLKNLLLFALFVFLAGFFDGLDGQIARLTNRVTLFGGFFDSFMDRTSEFFIFLGLFIYKQDQMLWVCIDMKIVISISFLASIMISYSRSRAEVFFKGDFDVGLMARSERLFYIVIISIISFFYDVIDISLFIFMLLVIGTFLFRTIHIYYILKKRDNQT
ncbi:MAG: CDP-alcohol phosphatidyltransferase family protein [Promethearchaeota archaeon]